MQTINSDLLYLNWKKACKQIIGPKLINTMKKWFIGEESEMPIETIDIIEAGMNKNNSQRFWELVQTHFKFSYIKSREITSKKDYQFETLIQKNPGLDQFKSEYSMLRFLHKYIDKKNYKFKNFFFYMNKKFFKNVTTAINFNTKLIPKEKVEDALKKGDLNRHHKIKRDSEGFYYHLIIVTLSGFANLSYINPNNKFQQKQSMNVSIKLENESGFGPLPELTNKTYLEHIVVKSTEKKLAAEAFYSILLRNYYGPIFKGLANLILRNFEKYVQNGEFRVQEDTNLDEVCSFINSKFLEDLDLKKKFEFSEEENSDPDLSSGEDVLDALESFEQPIKKKKPGKYVEQVDQIDEVDEDDIEDEGEQGEFKEKQDVERLKKLKKVDVTQDESSYFDQANFESVLERDPLLKIFDYRTKSISTPFDDQSSEDEDRRSEKGNFNKKKEQEPNINLEKVLPDEITKESLEKFTEKDDTEQSLLKDNPYKPKPERQKSKRQAPVPKKKKYYKVELLRTFTKEKLEKEIKMAKSFNENLNVNLHSLEVKYSPEFWEIRRRKIKTKKAVNSGYSPTQLFNELMVNKTSRFDFTKEEKWKTIQENGQVENRLEFEYCLTLQASNFDIEVSESSLDLDVKKHGKASFTGVVGSTSKKDVKNFVFYLLHYLLFGFTFGN